jgi:hypothetical protein
VQHAELVSVASYYRKAQIYGRSHEAFRHVEAVRPLSLQQRLRVFRQAARGQRRLSDSLYLAVLLIGGLLSWWYGSMRGGRQGR